MKDKINGATFHNAFGLGVADKLVADLGNKKHFAF